MDARTLIGKSLCGLQAWHNTPNDGAGQGWGHWFRPGLPATAENAAFDLYPDVSDFPVDELEATGMLLPDGQPARLFSSYRPRTMLRYFEWMERYGIDGCSLGRFLVGTSDAATRARLDRILGIARSAAEVTGRVFFAWIDVTGADASTFAATLRADQVHLQSLGVFKSPAYLQHRGKPLLGLWGAGAEGRPGTPEEWVQICNDFQVSTTVLLGGARDWRTHPAFALADVVSPWAVTAFGDLAGADVYRREVLEPDLALTKSRGQDYLPILWPGFSMSNQQQGRVPMNTTPRLGGRFYWRQAQNAIAAGASCLFTAMLDEFDEGTAILPIARTQAAVPVQGTWLSLDADGAPLPADWYLGIAGALGQALRGEIAIGDAIQTVTPLIQEDPPMSPSTPGTITDPEAKDFEGRLEDRYTQPDLSSSHAQRVTRVDWLGYGRWTSAYDAKRAAGLPHEEATRAVLAEIDAVLQPPTPVPPVPAPAPIVGDVVQLKPDPTKMVLRRPDSTLPFILGVTSFRLPELWCLDRPKAMAWLDFCQTHGLAPRGLCMYWNGIGKFDPRTVPTFPQQMRALAIACGDRGLRLLLDGCADLSQPQAPLATIVPADFVDALAVALYDLPNVIVGGGNEAPFNGWNPTSLRRAIGNFLWHRGTMGGDALPPIGSADLFANEGNRAGVSTGNWVKACKALYDVQIGNTSEQIAVPLPAIEMEPIGCGELDEDGRTSSNAAHWFDYAAGCKLFGDGLVIHLRAGITEMVPPGPRALACIAAARAGAAAVPDDARLGRYTRGPLVDCPLTHDDALALRTYVRLQGQTAVCVALVPQPGWKAVAVAPWRIVEQRGPRGNVVLVTRG